MRRVREQIFEQFAPLRAVTVAIEFDVPIDVVDEMTQAIIVVFCVIERTVRSLRNISGMMSSPP